MITTNINAQTIAKLSEILGNNSRLIKKELRVAVNETAKHLKKVWAKELSTEVALPQKIIRDTIKQELAKVGGDAVAAVSQNKSKRLPLKLYKPRQTNKGVSYTAYRRAKRQTLANSFMGPKPGAIAIKLGGHVWTRQGAKRVMTKGRYAGKMRQPIVKRYGPAPYEISANNRLNVRLVKEGREQLTKELKKRLRFQDLKARGVI